MDEAESLWNRLLLLNFKRSLDTTRSCFPAVGTSGGGGLTPVSGLTDIKLPELFLRIRSDYVRKQLPREVFPSKTSLTTTVS